MGTHGIVCVNHTPLYYLKLCAHYSAANRSQSRSVAKPTIQHQANLEYTECLLLLLYHIVSIPVRHAWRCSCPALSFAHAAVGMESMPWTSADCACADQCRSPLAVPGPH